MARRLELKGRTNDGTDPNAVGLRMMSGVTTGSRSEEIPGSRRSEPPAAQEAIRKHKGINLDFKLGLLNLCTYHPLLIFLMVKGPSAKSHYMISPIHRRCYIIHKNQKKGLIESFIYILFRILMTS
jgi:hypothetical protein